MDYKRFNGFKEEKEIKLYNDYFSLKNEKWNVAQQNNYLKKKKFWYKLNW